ncbi:ZIP family metal transporter [Paenibacillus wulumuqiensis]|uniref:ZIP family metal transporter n=1 Tax=Paenibacillus wulumuqiensis TaxID=1567107 RepID=UPI000619F6C3|nr:membrane protein [Paenibacillus wulumuqiensis]
MWNALMWGAIAGSAVLLGALVAIYFKIPKKIIGWIMAFGTGTLIGAASFELLGDAIEDGGLFATAIGFLVGAVVYTGFDLFISSRGGAHRKRSYYNRAEEGDEQDSSGQNSSSKDKGKSKGGSGLGIFAGTVMDAIPESIMIGASLLTGQGVSAVLVVSIFVSNIPEGLSSTVGMQQSNFSRGKIWGMWIAVLIVSSLASMLGYLFLETLPNEIKAGIGAFAGGGIIAMLCSTMAPEAYEEGGPMVGLIASLGLLVALMLSI